MAEIDVFVDLSQLPDKDTVSLSDILHVRSTGGIDSKITVADFIGNLNIGTILSASEGDSLQVDGNGKLVKGQKVRTTDPVTFASVDTGHGANEVYPQDQALRTTDPVTFASVDTGAGAIKQERISYTVTTNNADQIIPCPIPISRIIGLSAVTNQAAATTLDTIGKNSVTSSIVTSWYGTLQRGTVIDVLIWYI